MSYWQATKHPAPCLFFVGPLLVVYEYGVLSVAGSKEQAIRNGADVWLRSSLASLGLSSSLLAPLIIFAILFVWAIRRRYDPPVNLPSTLIGMAIESIAIAMGFWAMSRVFGPL